VNFKKSKASKKIRWKIYGGSKMFRKWKAKKIANGYLQVLNDLDVLKKEIVEQKGESETSEQLNSLNEAFMYLNGVQNTLVGMGLALHGIGFSNGMETLQESE